MATKKFKDAKSLLVYLNKEYSKLHTAYEQAFWLSKMGKTKKTSKDSNGETTMNAAMIKRDDFRSNVELLAAVQGFLQDKQFKDARGPKSGINDKKRLALWERFFTLYITPAELTPLRKEIADLESDIAKIQTTRQEGYIDPNTGTFVEASENKMRSMVVTEADWRLRKACYDAMEKLPDTTLPQYAKLVGLRNRYAEALGYANFYEYKLKLDENMTTKELRAIFDPIYEKTKYGFDSVRTMAEATGEVTNDDQSILKPWNFGYMMRGDLTKEEDQYFPFDEAVMRWKVSMVNLGVDFADGKLTLDLLDRKGKYNNGFCHWPKLVRYSDDGRKRFGGEANFTCNVVPGQVGSSEQGYNTLFHEGGHAAHLLNSMQTEVCVNHEYPPMSVSWAETQSQFMDTIMGSYEWLNRYAKNKEGVAYPFDLFERSVRKLSTLRPLGLMGISSVVAYELAVYELEASLHKKGEMLTGEQVKKLAGEFYQKYTIYTEPAWRLLNIPHIYSWESSAYYHGYGLAELALMQWREYFYDRYGYIVDNPRIGRDMAKVWSLGSTLSTNEMMVKATGRKLSPEVFIRSAIMSADQVISLAQKRLARMEKVKGKINPNSAGAKNKISKRLDKMLKVKIKVVK